MWRARLLFLASILVSSSLLAVFFMRFLAPNYRGLAAAIVPIAGFQNATSSSGGNDANASTTPGIVDVLQRLQDQNQFLAAEVADLRAKAEEANLKLIFIRTLKRGDSGDDVKALQTFLSGISSTTATSATGFYGGATEKTVKDFQMQAGLKETGIFDARTRDALATTMQGQTASSTAPDDGLAPIDLSSVADPQQNVQSLQNQVSQISSQLASTQTTLSGTQTAVADLQNQITSLESKLSDVQAGIAAQPPSSPAAPVVLPLAISNIQVGTVTRTSVTVTWTTNNPSTSEVDYSLNSSMPVTQTLVAKGSDMVTNHSTALSPLASGTTYYYHIISKDGSGTIANSSNLTFTTAH